MKYFICGFLFAVVSTVHAGGGTTQPVYYESTIKIELAKGQVIGGVKFAAPVKDEYGQTVVSEKNLSDIVKYDEQKRTERDIKLMYNIVTTKKVKAAAVKKDE